MDIMEERRGVAVLLTVNGRLDSTTSANLEERLLGLVNGGIRQLVLDFGGLEYISSAGLRVLLMVAKKLKPLAGGLALCGLQRHIREVFDLAGFSPLFRIHESVEIAFKD